ncbi:MAG TPA: T9SS type A sorting domain-containing protein [Dissulfurispiraceae bacterium]|nr:T9SS type A sorting domain-containing protein [Dissulfurispiraceae bacterium]
MHNYNGKIGFLNSGSLDLSVALAINTTGLTNIVVNYEIMTIRNPHDGSGNTRINEVILQYRVGTSGVFTNLTGTEYRNNTVPQTSGTEPQNLLPRTITLPAAADNQEVVQLRLVSRQVSGAGSRPSFAIDNVNITGVLLGTPVITATPSALSGFSYVIGGGPSPEQRFTASGSNLTDSITIAAPLNFEISLTSGGPFTTSLSLTPGNGTVPPTPVFVRLRAGLAGGNYSGDITLSSAGATNRTVALSGHVTYPPNFFRSIANGLWSAATTWQASADGITFASATRPPNYHDHIITIQADHTVTIDAAVTIDQVVIQDRATLVHSAGTLNIANGADNDVVIQTGGVFTFNASPAPVFASGAVCVVSPGAILRVARTGLTGAGAVIHSANIVFQNASILEYTHAGAFSANGVTFFPHVDVATIPVFRITSITLDSPGGALPTVINGIIEANSSFTWAGAGAKTFRNGIRGTGTMSQGTSGVWQITGTSAQLGSHLNLGANGLTTSLGSTVSIIRAISIHGGPVTVGGNLTITSGRTLTVGSGVHLSVAGVLSNYFGEEGLILLSGSSLTHATIGIHATMRRLFTGSERWRLISSPVEVQDIVDPWTPGGTYIDGTGFDFYAWSEAASTWLNQKVTANELSHFLPGRGYLVSFQGADRTLPFLGPLNAGDITVPLTRLNTGAHRGANLLGNPYPSSIDWNSATRTPFIDDFAYVYDPLKSGGEGYVPVDGRSPGALIAPNQGFFVIAAATDSFKFTNTMRRHGGVFKNAPVVENLVLRLSQGGFFDETTLRLIPESEWERDRSDAIKMFSFNPAVPQLFSLSANQVQLDVNSVPQVRTDSEFTIGLRAPSTGQYTLSLQSTLGAFATGGDVFIRDLTTGVVQNLSSNPAFSFHATQGDHPGRFVLSYTQPTSVGNVPDASTAIYVYNQVLYLNFAREENNDRQMQVIDLSGRVVLAKRLPGGVTSMQVLLGLQQGVYIVRITGENTSVARRVMVR